MSERGQISIDEIERRLRAKGLFQGDSDSISLRLAGEGTVLFKTEGASARRLPFRPAAVEEGDAGLHLLVYRTRPDVGAILLGATPWMSALAALGVAVPPLFDEQARHIGENPAPVDEQDRTGLIAALSAGGNAALLGTRRFALGPTPNRVVLNADLFEKCAKAFVLATSSGQTVRALPRWASGLWYAHLQSDQAKAKAAYAAGRVPEGMDAY